MKAFGANFSDLSGATNPQGIWSPHFLALKKAIDSNDSQENVLQAVYDWLGTRGIHEKEVDAILALDPQKAYSALVQKIGGGLNAERLPPQAQQSLSKAIQLLAGRYVGRREAELEQERGNLSAMRARYELESAEQIVRRLLA